MFDEQKIREFGKTIGILGKGQNLSRSQTKECYRQVVLNEQPELQQGAFLVAHLIKGPTTMEMAGAWDAMMEYDMEHIAPNTSEPSCDIVGTGSDALKTVNVSTPAALITSACGVPMAKKGARLVTGVSGASDVLESCGVDLATPLDRVEKGIEQYGIGYLPGEQFLKSGWSRLITVMRFTTVFNIIGPITMPCDTTKHIVIGTFAPDVCTKTIDILREIGMQSAMSMYGMSDDHEENLGIDEISICGPTKVWELRDKKIDSYTLSPSDFGIRQAKYADVVSKDTCEGNAQAILKVLKGEDEGPLLDLFCANAAVALHITNKAGSLSQGVDIAKQAVADGTSLEQLRNLVANQSSSKEGQEKLERLIQSVG